MSLDDSIERIRKALIRRMGRKAHLRHTSLTESLMRDTGESGLSVRHALARLSRDGWLEGVLPDGTAVGNVRIVGHIPQAPQDLAMERWERVLSESNLTDAEKRALLPLSAKLEEFDITSMEHILNGLRKMRANLNSEQGRHRFLVSARYLIGSSKLLDSLPTTALRGFGINPELFPTHPLYVVVAGAANPETVILVENPAAFEVAITTRAVERCAFVVTFGFGLSTSQEDYGNQLSTMVENRFNSTITLVREGSQCPSAKELLAHTNIVFWGDLDVAGMLIYRRLRKQIPSLGLSGIYRSMLESVNGHLHSHPYVTAVGKQGQKDMLHFRLEDDLPEVSHLLALCATRGVDQECVSPAEIEKWAKSKLDLGSDT